MKPTTNGDFNETAPQSVAAVNVQTKLGSSQLEEREARMSALPYMPLYWGDYFAETRHLSAEEHGAYLLLIGTYWQSGAPLTDDDERLARLVGVTVERWAAIRGTLAPFFVVAGGHWLHKRVDAELAKAREKVDAARRAGEASGKARAKRTPVERTFNARSTPVERTYQRNANQSESESESDKENTNNLGQSNPTAAHEPAAPGGAEAPDRPKCNIVSIEGSEASKRRRVTVEGVTANARRMGIPETCIRDAIRRVEAQDGVRSPGDYLATCLAAHEAPEWLRLNCIRPDEIPAPVTLAALRTGGAELAQIDDAFRRRGMTMGQTLEGRAS